MGETASKAQASTALGGGACPATAEQASLCSPIKGGAGVDPVAGGLRVTRWKKYGKDRSYVGPEDGPSVGYIDNLTGTVHVTDENDRPRIMAALGLAVPEETTPADPPYQIVIDRLARDLSVNVAGAAAREMAQQLKAQAPVRSLLARALGVHTDERAWRVGAEGERIIGRQLQKLEKDGWTVVHDVPIGERGSNIDHVLVGPGGVFTVNSKYHVGKSIWCAGDVVMVGGHKQPYVRNARFEASRASKLLSAAHGAPVPVTGLVVILGDRWTQKSQPEDGSVLVMGPRTARKHLAGLPVTWAAHEVDRLALWARRDTTWQP